MLKCDSFYLIIATFFCSVFFVSAQFPRVCLTAEVLISKECCPIPQGFKAKCGAPRRGNCRNIQPEEWNESFTYYSPRNEHDDRVRWPTVFFNRSCHCKHRFDGSDCGKCAFGRHGKNCEFFRTRVRRNIKHLSPRDALKYQIYLNLSRQVQSPYQVANMSYRDMKDKDGRLKPSFLNVSVYDFHVWSHHYSSNKAFGRSHKDPKHPNLSHNGQGFLTWHRNFVLNFERDLREITEDWSFTIPYWDWTHSPSCDVCTEMYAGKTTVNGTVVGPFISDWYAVCVSPDIICNVNNIFSDVSRPFDTNVTLPTPTELDFLMQFPTFDRAPYSEYAPRCFRNLLEGALDPKTALPTSIPFYHNAVHIFFGGTMMETPSAPNDPVFWLHHSFVDRVFEKWLRGYRVGPSAMTSRHAPMGHNRKSAIAPYFNSSRHTRGHV